MPQYRVTIHSVTVQVWKMKCVCDCKYFGVGETCDATLEPIGQCPWNYPIEDTVTVYVEDTGDEETNWDEAALEAENTLFLHHWTTNRCPVFVSLIEVSQEMLMKENGAISLFDLEAV